MPRRRSNEGSEILIAGPSGSGGKEKQKMQRFYEVMFIVRPDVADEDLDKLIAGLEQTVTNGGARWMFPQALRAAR